MATWRLEPSRENIHGHFSRDLKPILEIESGDTVDFKTLDARWYLERPESATAPEPRRVEPRDPILDGGHCLVGPVFIKGAKPGMTLEIRIEEILVSDWGWLSAGFPSSNNERLGVHQKFTFHLWDLDREAGTGTNQHGHTVKLNPFMGVMGMPTNEPGVLMTGPPRFTGGNLDCKELVAGSTLYLPIDVEGGLFSVGDGHAAQSDGEVCGTAIETGMENVKLTFILREDMRLKTPRIRTNDSWMCLGLSEDLDEANLAALDDMLDLMGELHSLDRYDAIALASLVVDMRVTQIANGVLGAHAVLRDGALTITP